MRWRVTCWPVVTLGHGTQHYTHIGGQYPGVMRWWWPHSDHSGVTGQWSHWQYPDTADKRDQSCDILSVTHTEQLSPELFTSFVLLIIVRFKFFTLGKILRDIFLGHVESDCFIWTQASQNLFFPNLSLSGPIWSWWIFHSVSRAVLRTWSPECHAPVSLAARGLISSRGPGVWFPRLDTIMPGHSGNYLRALSLSVLVFFANIYQDIPASIPSKDV